MNNVLTCIGIVLFASGALLCWGAIDSVLGASAFSNMQSMIWASVLPILYGILGLLGAVLTCAGLILEAVEKRNN